MTIKTRNISMLVLFFISAVNLLTSIVFMIYAIKTNTFHTPENIQQRIILNFFSNRFTFATAIISIFVLLIYVSAVSIYFAIAFEKTQSTEIIFFSLFLTGCLCESFRLMIPLMDLWNSFSLIAIISGRIVIFGRFLAPISLLAVSVASVSEQRQNVERNIAIIVITSLISTWFIPLDSFHASVRCIFPWGNSNTIFSVARIIFVIIAIVSQILIANAYTTQTVLVIAFAVLATGYLVLCLTFSIFTLAAGAVMLIAGSSVYIKKLHVQYLWR